MQRAALAAISTRSYTVDGVPLTGQQIVDFYNAMPDAEAMLAAIAAPNASSARYNRTVQVLKTSGLIAYDKPTRRWVRGVVIY